MHPFSIRNLSLVRIPRLGACGAPRAAPPEPVRAATHPTEAPVPTEPTAPKEAEPLSAAPSPAAVEPTVHAKTFEDDAPDTAPAGFTFEQAGPGRPARWLVRSDATAPAGPSVLAQLDDGRIESALAEGYGSTATWEQHFRTTGLGLGGGSGWVILALELDTGALRTIASANHTQTLSLGAPLLVLDVYEHSYHIDFGASVARYSDAFFANVNWEVVDSPLAAAQRARAALRGGAA